MLVISSAQWFTFSYKPQRKTCDNNTNNNIINSSICLRHISSNKTIQRRITLYSNTQITLKLKNRDVVVYKLISINK